MKLLLDLHVFLWYITGDAKLPPMYKAAIEDVGNEVLVGVVSVWEAVIKNMIGKLPFPAPPATYLPDKRRQHGFASLGVDEGALPHLATLPPHHNDPFDRLLIAQALQHGLTLLSVDAAVTAYPVPVLPPT
jgi:PIN domain nuclease of toxin-antitoxin system